MTFRDNYASVIIAGKKVFTDANIEEEDQEISTVLRYTRTLAYESISLDLFVMHNLNAGSFFGKVTGSFSPFDNFWVDATAGMFTGPENDVLGKLDPVDFISIGLRYGF